MQVQIRFAETGHTTKYIVPVNEKVLYIQQQIKRDYKIELADQRIISKSGATLMHDDRLEAIQTELQRTYVPEGEGSLKIQQLPCTYVFNEKALRSQQPLKSFSEEEILQTLVQRCESTATLREKNEFKPLVETLSKQEISRLQQANQNIREWSDQMLERYEEVRTTAYKFTQIKHCNDEVISMCENQVKACQTLYKCLNFRAEILARKRTGILKNFERLVKQFESSSKGIQELKNQNIPQKLQPEVKNKSVCTTVFDLFCEDYKYTEYFKKTTNTLSAVGKKLEIIDKQIEDYIKSKGRIYEDRKAVTSKFKTCKNQTVQISSRIEDYSQEVDSIKDKVRNKARIMMDFINRFVKSPEDTEALKYITSFGDIAKQNQREIEKTLGLLSEWVAEMTNCYVVLHRHQRLNQNFMKDAYRSYDKFVNALGTVDGELKKTEKEVVTITKEMCSSWSAKDITDAYNTTINEVCRRRSFFSKFEASYNQLLMSLDEELQKRKKYITNRKKLHQIEFVPQLMSHATPTLILEATCDLKLPKLDFSQQQQEAMDRSQRKEPDLKKQVLRLRQKLQKYEKCTESDSLIKELDQITCLANEMSHYKKHKENLSNPEFCKWETKITNLEGILTKTSKVFHQLYGKKLKEENKKHLEAQQLLNKQITELKKRNKLEISELNRSLEDQMKGCLMEIGRLKEQVIRKDDQIKALTAQIKDTQRNLRYLNDQKQLLSSENFMISDERRHLQQQLEKSKARISQVTRLFESQKQLACQLKILLGDQQVKLIQKDQQINKLHKQNQQKTEKMDDDSISEDERSQKGHLPERMELMRLKEENISLKEQLENLEGELNLIIMKETFDIQTQTGEHVEPGCVVNIDKVERGKRMIFIPFANGIYLPVSMVDTQKTCTSLSNTTISSYRSNYFLDMGSLEGKTRDFLNECSLIIISKVGHIRERITTIDDNPFGLKINEAYYLIEVEKPEFVIGFEEEDISIKNYAEM